MLDGGKLIAIWIKMKLSLLSGITYTEGQKARRGLMAVRHVGCFRERGSHVSEWVTCPEARHPDRTFLQEQKSHRNARKLAGRGQRDAWFSVAVLTWPKCASLSSSSACARSWDAARDTSQKRWKMARHAFQLRKLQEQEMREEGERGSRNTVGWWCGWMAGGPPTRVRGDRPENTVLAPAVSKNVTVE